MTSPRRHRGASVAVLVALLLTSIGLAAPASAASSATATDTFTRTVTNGLGTADAGGAWTLAGTASRFSVSGGRAALSTPAGVQYSGYLGSTSIRDTDLAATLGVSAMPVGNKIYIGLVARHAGSSEYNGRIIIAPNGTVQIGLLAGATGLAVATVPGMVVSATTSVRMRMQTIGANPTTVRARAWKVGTVEPSTWQVSATDGTAALQSAGSVGIRTYLSSAATNGPVAGTFDDLTATAVPPANAPPTASFTAAADGLTVTVDGDASSDADGTIVSHAWSFGDGSTASGSSATHAYSAAGSYVVTLVVTDDGEAVGTAQRTIVVAQPNVTPTASFIATSSGLSIAVNGSGSADPDGVIRGYAWNFGDGATATGAVAAHDYASPGTYAVTLVVTDDEDATAMSTKTLDVGVADVPPAPSFTSSSTGLTVAVDGSASSDVDGTIVDYAWNFGDGAAGSGATTSHTYSSAGTYAIGLTVTDDRGTASTATQLVVVSVPNQPPVPNLLEQQTGLTALFIGDSSADPDGTIAAYRWSFGDGATSTAVNPARTYAAAGTYAVSLTVTDDRGATATVTRSITVFPTGVKPTQAQWLADASNALSGGADVLDANRGVMKPAIVLDIDNTSLQSYYQPFSPTAPVLAFEQRAIAGGYTILFATGRSADTGGTLKQLKAAGYRVDALCFRDPAVTTQASKIACRNAWTAQGYTIVADVGNHTTDLTGGNAGRQYLLPNYGFLD